MKVADIAIKTSISYVYVSTGTNSNNCGYKDMGEIPCADA